MSFQVKGSWEDGSGSLGTASSFEDAIALCDAKGCVYAWVVKDGNDFLYKVQKGFVMKDGVVLYTTKRELQPLFDSIRPLHEKLYEAEEKIALKMYQLKKLMELDAKQTKAPLSLSCLLTAGPVFSNNLGFDNNEESIEKTLPILKEKLQKAQYLAGELDEWVVDWVEQTGYKGCLADL